MRRLIGIAVLSGLLSGCATTPEFSWNLGPRTSEDGRNVAVTFEFAQQLNEHWRCAYVHQSLPQKGRPFNDEYEVTTDQLGCGMRWGGKPR